MTFEPLTPVGSDPGLVDLAAESKAQRRASLRALHLLEYALAAPAPRRHRTWVHRVTIALDVLGQALNEQLHAADESIDALAEIALSEPRYALGVQHLRQDLIDLSIALASLREQIETDPELRVDPDEVRDRLATLTRRFRQHRASEADLIYQARGIDVNHDVHYETPHGQATAVDG